MNIKQLIKVKNLTNKAVADKLGVHFNTIGEWTTEKRQIPDKYLPKLAEIFDVEISEIIKLKYDLSDENINRVEEKGAVYNKQINKYSGLSEADLQILLKQNKQILGKINSKLDEMLANGNTQTDIEMLLKYEEFKRKVLKTITDIKLNL